MELEGKERLELVTQRLQEELALQDDFFKDCCKLALGMETGSYAYLSYRLCREKFGHKYGVYLCLVYAQLYASRCLLKEAHKILSSALCDEFACINRELFSLILLMTKQHDSPEEIRDALYWFYSDYCELFVQLHFSLLQAGVTVQFGGPFLISTPLCRQSPDWKQHTWDCGLYLGKRFEERFFQAVRKQSAQNDQDMCRTYAALFPQEAHTNEGFLLTSWQKEQWKQMTTQLRLMAE